MSDKRIGCSSSCGNHCQLRREVNELRNIVIQQGSKLNRILDNQQRGSDTGVRDCDVQCVGGTNGANGTNGSNNLVKVTNPHLKQRNPDVLYHLGLDTGSTDFPKEFGDVKFVCLGGSADRMHHFAMSMGKKLNVPTDNLPDLAAAGHRFSMYKVGPILCVSHGLGTPCIGVLLNELIKMMYHARCDDPIFIRMGVSGGVGVPPGTIVLTQEAVDGQMRNSFEVVVQGKPQQRPTKLNEQLLCEIYKQARPNDTFDTIIAKTMCTNDFYEGQSRLDGAFADYGEREKNAFLNKLAQMEVHNIDMESAAFAALTKQAGIRSAIVSVTLVDRLNGDDIESSVEELESFEQRPQVLVDRYISKVLNLETASSRRPSTASKSAKEPRTGPSRNTGPMHSN